MATFEAQVEGLTSLSIDGSSAPTQTELTQFLTDGAAEVINAMPAPLKFLCATEDTFTSTAVGSEAETLESSSVLSVTRSDGTIDQPCREIPAVLRGKASDSDDMIAATATDPVYYVYNGKINALPASGSCKYLEVNNPSVSYSDSAISNFPDEYEYLVPLYASVKLLSNKLNTLIKSDLSISASAPSAPSLATLSYSNASNADASSSAVSAITVSTVSVADTSGNVPAYTKPTLTTRVSFEDFFSLSEDGNPFGDSDPGVFSLSTPPTLSSASFTTPAIGSITIASFGTAPAYTPPTVGGATEELTAAITAGTAGTDSDQQDVSDWWEVLGDFIEDSEDTELASAQISKLNSYISAYQAALQNQLNVFNDANVEYQSNIQKQLQQARIDAEDSQQEASLLLQKEVQEYQAKVSEYQAEVNADVQVYSKKLDRYQAEVNTAFQAWSTTEGNSLQQYTLDIQNELNEFNKENVRYQASIQAQLAKHQTDLQVALRQAQINAADAQQEASQATDVDKFNKSQDQALDLQNKLQTLQAAIQNNDDLVSKFSAELNKYSAQVNSEVQAYAQNLSNNAQAYQNYLQQQVKLQADYDKGIQILRGG